MSSMEVLLLSDLPGVGKKNDLLIVGNGYALNYLLPARKAIVVTPNVRKRYAEQIKKRAMEKDQERQNQSSVLQAIAGKSLRIMAKAGKTGKLYAAISSQTIAEEALKQFKLKLHTQQIKVDEAIKSVGTHTVKIQIGEESVQLPVEVIAADEVAVKKAA